MKQPKTRPKRTKKDKPRRTTQGKSEENKNIQ
jgi:hypothetical protein